VNRLLELTQRHVVIPPPHVGETRTTQSPGIGRPWITPPSVLFWKRHVPAYVVPLVDTNSPASSEMTALVPLGTPLIANLTSASGCMTPVVSKSIPCTAKRLTKPVLKSRYRKRLLVIDAS